ncbi:hypothetical protein EDD11_007007 [Mortierella claussenii]|nr:hypothetical protein EDD11_007007 [Mortierella claussenii]
MRDSPKILIVGAGLGGLMLALLLERIGVDYDIFERSVSLKPYGAGMSLGANILPVFEQLGLLEDLLKISYPGTGMDIYKEDLTQISRMSIGGDRDSRPELHSLLLSKLPPGRIHYGKKVLSVGQSEHGALIRCADGSMHEADILVGADGAYSAVRQSLYERLQKTNQLPKSDTESLKLGYTCLVGTTVPQDPEKYPVLKDNAAHFAVVIADQKPYSWTLISVPGNRICYGISIQLTAEQKETAFRNSEWGPEMIESTIEPFAHHATPFGGTLGDLINATPKDLISNVYLEEKLFETWNHGRIALIGDGAINAMQDAVIIANCIYELNSTSHQDIEAALQAYRDQRYAHAKEQVRNSNVSGKLLYGQTWLAKTIRKVVMYFMPKEFEKSSLTSSAAYRPQATFLPRAQTRGTLEIVPQKPSKRYQEEQEKKQKAAQRESGEATMDSQHEV